MIVRLEICEARDMIVRLKIGREYTLCTAMSWLGITTVCTLVIECEL